MKVVTVRIEIANKELIEYLKIRPSEFLTSYDSRDLHKSLYVVRVYPNEENKDDFYDYQVFENYSMAHFVEIAIEEGKVKPFHV